MKISAIATTANDANVVATREQYDFAPTLGIHGGSAEKACGCWWQEFLGQRISSRYGQLDVFVIHGIGEICNAHCKAS